MSFISEREHAVSAQFDGASAAEAYAASHDDGASAHFSRTRIALVERFLQAVRGGSLLDVGCGPGMMVRDVQKSRPGEFRITALDRSQAMVDACIRNAGEGSDVRATVGRVEQLPFEDGEFDVVIAMGILEYTDVPVALAEITRVTRPGGLVLVTMLNPRSPYRFVQFRLFWPLLRTLRRLEALRGVPPEHRHGRVEPGIRLHSERRLRDMFAGAGLEARESAYFDATLLVPPLDRYLPRTNGELARATPNHGWREALSTAYLLAAHKPAG
ncbi:methyltransferase domain-containing protein [Amycolatopsis sp. K13G38]|uniref:Methyltransferase domain-containing protein n=1 Tax=Amycolatopsis acididurans TaxID=2724524 RepID=A0ABX1JB37_9PSEU|nr:class I SAM-dependent methyltransferase [Amycolatopsis acididurans]NKQ56704.1 methyltransferase domain-containing protein [Amycolatopsis acididurans]